MCDGAALQAQSSSLPLHCRILYWLELYCRLGDTVGVLSSPSSSQQNKSSAPLRGPRRKRVEVNTAKSSGWPWEKRRGVYKKFSLFTSRPLSMGSARYVDNVMAEQDISSNQGVSHFVRRVSRESTCVTPDVSGSDIWEARREFCSR